MDVCYFWTMPVLRPPGDCSHIVHTSIITLYKKKKKKNSGYWLTTWLSTGAIRVIMQCLRHTDRTAVWGQAKTPGCQHLLTDIDFFWDKAWCWCVGDYHVLPVDMCSVSGIFRNSMPDDTSMKEPYRLNMAWFEMISLIPFLLCVTVAGLWSHSWRFYGRAQRMGF